VKNTPQVAITVIQTARQYAAIVLSWKHNNNIVAVLLQDDCPLCHQTNNVKAIKLWWSPVALWQQ